MSSFAARVRADMQIEVVELREISIASFADAAHAETFLKMLRGEIRITETDTPAAESEPPEPASQPEPAPAPPIGGPDVPAEAMLAAFERIESGDRLRDVADDLGLPFGKLCSLWANHVRHHQKETAGGGQIDCAICARPFTPSQSSPDLCARCARG